MSRRLARELAMQALYQRDLHPDSEDTMFRSGEKKLSEGDFAYYSRLKQGTEEHRTEIDQTVQKYLKKGWTVNRLSAVERAILRIAVYELQQEQETPSGVVLNEAVELAKKFSGVESSRFINGVLGSMVDDYF